MQMWGCCCWCNAGVALGSKCGVAAEGVAAETLLGVPRLLGCYCSGVTAWGGAIRVLLEVLLG